MKRRERSYGIEPGGVHTTYLQELIKVYDFLGARIRGEFLSLWVLLQWSESQKTFSEMSEKWDWKGPWKSLTLTLTNEGTEALKVKGLAQAGTQQNQKLWYSFLLWGHGFSLYTKRERGSDGTEDGF